MSMAELSATAGPETVAGDDEAEADVTEADVAEADVVEDDVTEADVVEDDVTEADDAGAEAAEVDAAEAEDLAARDTGQDTAEAAGDAEAAADEAEEPLVEARVVPDAPVEAADEPLAVSGTEEEPAADQEPEIAVIPPSFDTVRITPDGRAVIAGRAPPGAEVSVKSEAIDLGSETANLSGEWTLVPYVRIPPGDHEFSAIATLPDGTQVESDQVLIVSVPDPDEEDGSVLALLMPREGDGKSTVLQKPAPKDEEIELAGRDDATADEPVAETEKPEADAAEADRPDADDAEAGKPDTDVAEAGKPEADAAEADEPDADVAEAGQPDADVAAADEPDADVADAAEPGADAAEDETDLAAIEQTAPADASDEDELAAAEPSEAEDEGPIVVDTVDYDDEGEITIAGKAEPEADLNVYIDEEHVGTVETTDEGEWEVTPETKVDPGAYTLRVDQVDPAGLVLARIETPLVRARPELLMLGDAIVVVQPGNSLWRIARRTLGGGVHFTEIYEANQSQIKDPELIYPGQIFTVPGLDD